VEDADQVHDDVGAADRGRQAEVLAEVRDDRHDLADVPGGFEEQGLRRVPRGDAHDGTGPGEPPHDVASDEAGAAEHRRRRVAVRHDRSTLRPIRIPTRL
jgi:hypothetical protein